LVTQIVTGAEKVDMHVLLVYNQYILAC